MMMNETRRRSQAHFDWQLLVAAYALSFFGVLCIAIAMFNPDNGTDLSLLGYIAAARSSTMQCVWLLISPIVLGFILAVPLDIFRARVRLIYYGVLALLVVTLLMSQAVNSIKAWLSTGFGRAVQPAEFAKISVLLMLARQLTRTEKPMGTLRDFLRTGLIVGVPCGVVLLQGETGSVIVIAVMFLVMIYFADVDIRIVLGIVAVAALAIGFIVGYAVLSGSEDYRILRLLAFLDPVKYEKTGGYQVLRAQEAIGAGQIWGTGAFRLNSLTTLGKVPESSTDFIFTVVGESFGLVGCLGVLGVYLFIILRMLYLARFTNDRFGRLIIVGVMGMLLFHVFENIAMCLGLMPITGIPLPFLSYGGSSYVTNMAGIALVLSVTRSRSAASMLYVQLPKYSSGLSLRNL